MVSPLRLLRRISHLIKSIKGHPQTTIGVDVFEKYCRLKLQHIELYGVDINSKSAASLLERLESLSIRYCDLKLNIDNVHQLFSQLEQLHVYLSLNDGFPDTSFSQPFPESNKFCQFITIHFLFCQIEIEIEILLEEKFISVIT